MALELAVRQYFTTIANSGLTIASLDPTFVSARPTIEIIESNYALRPPTIIRSGSDPNNTINFTKFDNDAFILQFEAIGAGAVDSCLIYGWRDNVQYLALNTPATYTFPALSPGQYNWQIYCYSLDSSATTMITATATILQHP